MAVTAELGDVRTLPVHVRGVEELTPRELNVLEMMAAGYSNPGIAETLVVSLRTVESHVAMIFLKLGIAQEDHLCRRVRAVLLYQQAYEAPFIAA